MTRILNTKNYMRLTLQFAIRELGLEIRRYPHEIFSRPSCLSSSASARASKNKPFGYQLKTYYGSALTNRFSSRLRARTFRLKISFQEDDDKVVDVSLDSFANPSAPSEALQRSAGAVPTAAENIERFYGVEASPAPGSSAEKKEDKKPDSPKTENNVEIDEDLFGGECDLDDLDEQLGDLALEEAGMS